MTCKLHLEDTYAVLTANEMRTLEMQNVKRGDNLTDMMERAGVAVADYIMENFTPCNVLVLCGPGNNGGDGYVAANKLTEAGWDVRLADDDPNRSASEMVEHHRAFWQEPIAPLTSECLDGVDIIIDALFGTGLERPLEGKYKDMVEAVNNSNCTVISVDCPSGVNSDTGHVMGCAIKADATVVMSNLKPGLLLLPGSVYAGELEVADINLSGLSQDHQLYFNHPDLWRQSLPHPSALDHKYSRGHVLMVGSSHLMGAGLLASKSARRMGAGAVTLACDNSVAPLYAASSPGLITKPIEDFDSLLQEKQVSAVLLGPGNGVNRETRHRVLSALETGIPCVLDADALSSFVDDPKTLFSAIHEKVILTPHEGEYIRLFGLIENKVLDARRVAKETGATLLLKGADTVIAEASGLCLIHSYGSPNLATAGSGDVLAGAISGLLSQGLDPFISCAAGAWAQAQAARSFGEGVIAEDLPDLLPKAFEEE